MDRGARKLLTVSVINLGGFIIELLGGVLFGSVALMSDAVHMLFDAISYAMAFATTWVATTRDGGDSWTYGFHRLEVLSAFINGATLVPMAAYILLESYRRFVSPVDIQAMNVLYVALFGLFLNLLSVYILERDEMGLNERGAYFHLLGDAAGSFAVIIGAVVVQTTGLVVVDPVIASLIALLVLWSAFTVLRRSLNILLQKSPVPVSAVEAEIESIDGVTDAHDIRVWEVCSKICVATVHAVVEIEDMEAAAEIRERISEKLKHDFGLQHVTVQIEKEECVQDDSHGAPTGHDH